MRCPYLELWSVGLLKRHLVLLRGILLRPTAQSTNWLMAHIVEITNKMAAESPFAEYNHGCIQWKRPITISFGHYHSAANSSPAEEREYKNWEKKQWPNSGTERKYRMVPRCFRVTLDLSELKCQICSRHDHPSSWKRRACYCSGYNSTLISDM